VNIGNPTETTVLELAERIRELCGSRSPIRFVERPVDDPQVRRPDTSLAQQLLGWRATTPPDEGLRQTVRWFRQRADGFDRVVEDSTAAPAQTRTEASPR
jgi:dTDP-glucose 4,6-dehydratase